jgi:hypothetical protein
MPHRLTWTQMQKAVQCALRVTQAAIDGLGQIIVAGHVFDLRATGRCQETVREFVEAGNGWAPHTWEFGDDEGSAKVALAHMDAAGFRLPSDALLVPGDIVGHRRGAFGHIGLFVGVVDGVPTVAENTSSGKRGNPRRPGTKRTPLNDFTGAGIEAYRLVKPERVGVFVNGKQVHPIALLFGNTCYVPRRKTAEALGATLEPENPAIPPRVNGKPMWTLMFDGVSWCKARDLADRTGATVAWTPGRVEFTTGGG